MVVTLVVGSIILTPIPFNSGESRLRSDQGQVKLFRY